MASARDYTIPDMVGESSSGSDPCGSGSYTKFRNIKIL